MFTDAQLTDIRRFCGYPAYGGGPSGFQSWRFFQAYGLLEYRLQNLSPAEMQVVLNQLAILYPLEAAVPNAGTNLDTAQAAVWTHNAREVADRAALFDDWRRRLCAFLGVPPGPGLASGGSIALVV
jgi:hypothetical protein